MRSGRGRAVGSRVPSIVKTGLAQMDDAGLQRVIEHEGPMLLTGEIYHPASGSG